MRQEITKVLKCNSPISPAFSGQCFSLATQTPTSPIPPGFSGQCFSLAAAMCNWISRVKNPKSPSSHAFSGTSVYLAAPVCQVDFLGKTHTSPISPAFSGQWFSLAAPMLVVSAFPLLHPCALRQKPTSPSSHTCVQWNIFLPCCAHVPGRFPGSKLTPTSPISPAFSGQCFSLAAPMCN